MADRLKNRIMRRVYAIWFIKRVAPVLFLEMPFLVLIAAHETAREFFVAKILENFFVAYGQAGAGGVFGFANSALAHASFLPVSIIVFSLALAAVLVYRLARNFSGFSAVRSYY